MQGHPVPLALILIAALLTGCLTNGKSAESAQAKPADPGNGNRPAEPPGQAKKHDDAFSDTSVFPGAYRTKNGYSLTLQTGPYQIGEPRVENLNIGREGANVQVAYVLPLGSPKTEFPVIVQASVYYDALKPETLRRSYNSNPEQSINFLIDNYVPHGYAVAFVPVRGSAGNGGCYEWWGPNERHDLEAALRWITAQNWSLPRLGLIGLSLGGAAAWMAAGSASADIPVKTIVPISSETDLYTWFVRNGTASAVAAPVGTVGFWGVYSVSPFTDKGRPGRDYAQIPNGLQCPTLATAIAANAYMTATGARDDLGYAQDRDLRPMVEKNYDGSIFLVTGLNDWLAHPHLVYPWINELEQRGTIVKHLLGQWRHRMPDDASGGPFFQPTRRIDFAEILLHWWDYWLKEDKKQDLGPRVQVADSASQWRNEAAWPPHDAITTRYYASAAGLTMGPGADQMKPLLPDPRRSLLGINGSGDPRNDCHGCAFFETTSLATDLRISGIPYLKATVTPAGPGGVITAYLYSVHEGKTQRVGWATLDIRYADGGNTPDPIVPGTPVTVRLQFEPLDAVLPTGAKLLLEVGQGGYGDDIGLLGPPVKALAPAAYYRNSVPPMPLLLQAGGDKTVLELPVIHRDRSAFFTAPTETT